MRVSLTYFQSIDDDNEAILRPQLNPIYQFEYRKNGDTFVPTMMEDKPNAKTELNLEGLKLLGYGLV